MPAGANAPVDVTEDPVEIFDEAQCPHRHGEIDLVGSNEGELGRTDLVKFDRDVVFGVAVGRDHVRAASSEPDGRVAGTAAEVEDLAAASIADHAMVDVVDESGAEFDIVERASARRPRQARGRAPAGCSRSASGGTQVIQDPLGGDGPGGMVKSAV